MIENQWGEMSQQRMERRWGELTSSSTIIDGSQLHKGEGVPESTWKVIHKAQCMRSVKCLEGWVEDSTYLPEIRFQWQCGSCVYADELWPKGRSTMTQPTSKQRPSLHWPAMIISEIHFRIIEMQVTPNQMTFKQWSLTPICPIILTGNLGHVMAGK